MSEWTSNYEWDGISAHIWHVVCISTQLAYSHYAKKHIFFLLFFNLMLVRYVPGLGISEIRDLFFRGPIWMRDWRIAAVLRWAGAADIGRLDKTEEACERRICPSLSRPSAAGPASNLFVVVEGVFDVIRTRYLMLASARGPRCTVFSLFFCSFFRLLRKNTLF